MSRFIELPEAGRLIIVTDIHGNWDDWYKYTREIWDMDDENCHIIFTGDYIHGLKYSEDMSLDILDEIDKFWNKPNFHILLGNHELMQILRKDVYKDEINQTKTFLEHVEDKCDFFGDVFSWQIMYEETMKEYNWYAKTQNGIFIMHAGPHDIAMKKLEDKGETLLSIGTQWNDENIDIIEDFIWARPWDDYTPNDIDKFLSTVDCHTMVVGHTPCGWGYGIFGSQIILSSSFGADRKCYIDIPLDADVRNVDDVAKYIQKL